MNERGTLKQTVIAVDVMGGDEAPDSVLQGVFLSAQKHPDIKFLLFGDEQRVTPLLRRFPLGSEAYDLIHCDQVITGDMKPSSALRNGKQSSMRLAIEAVKEGRAHGVVSAGNTGAYMAFAKVIVKTLEGINRPAIAGVIPTAEGSSILLDMGANIDCTADNLVQFAMMGEVFGRIILHKNNPSVGLLNVGAEELKGNERIKDAAFLLREGGCVSNFMGFVEGDAMLMGKTDIIVTDGFSGNVALKTAEGTVKLLVLLFKRQMQKSLLARLGVFLASVSLKKLRDHIDPRKHNGAILLGLNGIVVKSHGGADGLGFSSAITVAYELIANNVVSQIQSGLEILQMKSEGMAVSSHETDLPCGATSDGSEASPHTIGHREEASS